MKTLNKTVTAKYMNKTQDFSEDEVKVIWDPTKTWTEATKNDPDELYLYKYPSSNALYIKYNGVKILVNITMKDFD